MARSEAEILFALLKPAIARASTKARIQRLIKMRGSDEVNRLLKDELERRVGTFAGAHLTERVQRQLATAIEDGIEEIARLGCDA